jgi:hypothetical protein
MGVRPQVEQLEEVCPPSSLSPSQLDENRDAFLAAAAFLAGKHGPAPTPGHTCRDLPFLPWDGPATVGDYYRYFIDDPPWVVPGDASQLNSVEVMVPDGYKQGKDWNVVCRDKYFFDVNIFSPGMYSFEANNKQILFFYFAASWLAADEQAPPLKQAVPLDVGYETYDQVIIGGRDFPGTKFIAAAQLYFPLAPRVDSLSELINAVQNVTSTHDQAKILIIAHGYQNDQGIQGYVRFGPRSPFYWSNTFSHGDFPSGNIATFTGAAGMAKIARLDFLSCSIANDLTPEYKDYHMFGVMATKLWAAGGYKTDVQVGGWTGCVADVDPTQGPRGQRIFYGVPTNGQPPHYVFVRL